MTESVGLTTRRHSLELNRGVTGLQHQCSESLWASGIFSHSPVPWSHPLLFLLFPATRLTQMLWSILVWVKLGTVANTPQKCTLESKVSYFITDGSEVGEYTWIHEHTRSWGSPSLQSFWPQVDVAPLFHVWLWDCLHSSRLEGERHGGPPCKRHWAKWKQVMSLLLIFHLPALLS